MQPNQQSFMNRDFGYGAVPQVDPSSYLNMDFYGNNSQGISGLSPLAQGGNNYAPMKDLSFNRGALPIGAIPGTSGGAGGGSFWSGMTGKDGWGGLALGAAQGITGAYMGLKQYGLAKDALNHNKMMFSKNYEAQRKTTNTQMADRQRARVASNEGAYQSVGAYMKENEVK